MSQISQIKQQVNQIGQQATQTAGQMNALSQSIEKNIAAVSGAIGGTANGEDKEMIASFQAASNAVKEAAQALQAASAKAKEWASKA